MSQVNRYGDIDVVQAAKIRLKNIWSSGLKVYFSLSGGKDSVVLADIIYKMIMAGELDKSQLVVIFIDEEAIWDSLIDSASAWRKKFMLIGVEFRWYCLEVRHFNCFNSLYNDESFICWDRNKEDVWIGKQPPFAIKFHPLLSVGKDAYQAFFPRITKDGIQIAAVRVAESVQRAHWFAAHIKASDGGRNPTSANLMFPTWDMKDNDVWLYIQRNNLDIPIAYKQLWEVGVARNKLRLAIWFSVDVAHTLVLMAQYDPGMMERIMRREPNAYISALYYDSEMFRRTSKTRKQLEPGLEEKDYRKIVLEKLSNIEGNFDTIQKKRIARKLLKLANTHYHMLTNKEWRAMDSVLIAGDPKGRTIRAIYIAALYKHAIAIGASKAKGAYLKNKPKTEGLLDGG